MLTSRAVHRCPDEMVPWMIRLFGKASESHVSVQDFAGMMESKARYN